MRRTFVSLPPVPFRAVALLLAMLTASLALNLALALRRGTERAAAPPGLIGITAPVLTAKDVSTGRLETFSYGDFPEPTVIYVFTPTCSWCARNLANFKVLVSAVESRFHIVGLSLAEQGTSEYVNQVHFRFPIYTAASPEFSRALHLDVTPQTIVISRAGVVIANWLGAWSGVQQSQVESYFRVRMPGLSPPPQHGQPQGHGL
jgi:hypothetical protein